eukprot:1600004-Pyramimonas_sp.AAC.1
MHDSCLCKLVSYTRLYAHNLDTLTHTRVRVGSSRHICSSTWEKLDMWSYQRLELFHRLVAVAFADPVRTLTVVNTSRLTR